MFEHIEVLIFRASFTARKEGELPNYLGSTLRGILGHCMRDFVCRTPEQRCYLCDLAKNCLYAECFCSPGNVAGAVNPFVLNVLVRNKTKWQIGDKCSFDIVLIGKITRHAGVFLDAMQAMGSLGWGVCRIPFSLDCVIIPERNVLVFHNGKTWLRNMQPMPVPGRKRLSNEVLVRFDTPVRVLENRNLCEKLSFASLIRSVSRRIALISHAYTGHIIEWDDEKLIEKAEKIKTADEEWKYVAFERYSMNHDGKLALPAIEGWARYTGDLTPFTPLLEAGSVLHAGKNATIGFGHYNVNYDR